MRKNGKKALSLLLAMVLALGMLPGAAFAADEDFKINDEGVLVGYNGPGGDVVIPDRVTSIGYGVFAWSTGLTSVTIPNSVTSIGQYAFRECTGLTSVTIPNSVTRIEESAFAGCTDLTSVTIPDSVTSIGPSAFAGCKGLTSVTIPGSVTGFGFGSSSFSNCTGLSSVTIQNGVTYISAAAFGNCTSLTDVIIPDSVTSIERDAFSGCESLTSITIPNNVTDIRWCAFFNCNSLKDVYYTGTVTQWQAIKIDSYNDSLISATIHYDSTGPTQFEEESISGKCGDNLTWTLKDGTLTISGTGPMLSAPMEGAQWFDISGLHDYIDQVKEVVVSEGVTSICSGAFCFRFYNNIYPCENLVKVTISNTVESIGASAFRECPLQKISIPDSVKSIDGFAFCNCPLKEVIIGKSVTRIGNLAFYRCPISNVYYGGTKEEWGKISIGSDNKSLLNANIHYNSTGPNDIDPVNPETPEGITSVYFLSGWDAATRTVQFGDNESTPITYTVANSVDVSNISSLLNKYVLVTMEQGDSSLKYTITDIKPVESKIGTVSATGEHSLTIEGKTYPVREDYKLASHDGKEILYHVSNGTIMGFDVLEERHGVLGSWNETTKRVTIGGKEYPTNELTDFSFKSNKDYLNKEVSFLVVDTTDYCPLLKITGVDDPKVNSDTYIVEEVKKYASQTDIDQLNDIFASNDSDIVKMQRLQEFFALNGFTDIKEGVKYYTQDSFAERQAYRKLTTDECFTAYQTQKFLDDHPEWRALLVADGLIFNGELNTYINPLTYADLSNLPDVEKYKDVLYEFMDAQSFDTEIMDCISWVNQLASNIEKPASIYADDLISQINNCKNPSELKTLLNKAETKKVMLKLGFDSSGKLSEYRLDENTGFGKFNKAMGNAGTFISVYNFSVENILDFIELDSKLAVYASYQNFLNEVMYAKDLPLGMRAAAAHILKEIDSGVWGRLKKLAVDIAKEAGADKKLEEAGFKAVLGKTGYASFSEVLLYLNLGSWAINQVVDIESIVKGSASAEAYSKLSTHFKNKLEEIRITFLSNQTPENAWIFYENYNILYSLRKNGEEAALKAHTFKVGSKGALGLMIERGYSYLNAAKEECVSEILDELEKCKFTVAPNIKIPESIKYVSKALTACPVNVDVYAPDGTYITTLQDGVESDTTNEYGRFAVVYRTFTGDYAKVICMSQKGNYKFNIVGTGDGLVDFEMATTKGSNTEIYKFSNEPVSKGALIKVSSDDLVNRQLYSVDMDGDGVVDKEKIATKIGEQTAKVSVVNITLSEATVSLRTGENKLLTVEVTPNNATTKNVLWTSSDTRIADVKDGKIIAKATGSTVIHCIAQDNPDIVATCNVTVTGNSQFFTDVPSDAWYYGAVKFVSEQKLMNGIGNNLFAPQSNLSRAQLAQILYNKEGKPVVSDNSNFTDVPAGQWYTSAVIWANKQGIVGGYGNELFGPNDDITREQLAVMLWRYAGKPAASGTTLNFNDEDKVSSWALDAMRWATEKGIVNGKGNGILDPGGKATRAETAQMLKNFLEK